MKTVDEILAIASTRLPEAGVECLLIGGFAVNHYGYTRNTLDVDFMIVADRIDAVRKIMQNELNIESDLRPLCDRFGNADVYELIRNHVEALRET